MHRRFNKLPILLFFLPVSFPDSLLKFSNSQGASFCNISQESLAKLNYLSCYPTGKKKVVNTAANEMFLFTKNINNYRYISRKVKFFSSFPILAAEPQKGPIFLSFPF